MSPAIVKQHDINPSTDLKALTTHDATCRSFLVTSCGPMQFAFRTSDFGVSRLYGLRRLPAAHLVNDDNLKSYMNPDRTESATSFAQVGEEVMVPDGINFTQLDSAPSTYISLHRIVSVEFIAVVEGDTVLKLDPGEFRLLKRVVSHDRLYTPLFAFTRLTISARIRLVVSTINRARQPTSRLTL